jgi:hypothetical protein
MQGTVLLNIATFWGACFSSVNMRARNDEWLSINAGTLENE